MHFALFVPEGGDDVYAVAHQAAFAGPQRLFGIQQWAAEMLGQAFNGGGIFRDEGAGSLQAYAGRII